MVRPGDSEQPGEKTSVAWRFAGVEYDPAATPPLRVDGEPVEVEPRPLEVLAELLRHVGEVVTKEELLDAVWEGRPTVDHVLANAVSKLRAVLGPAGAAHIVTVPRVGYRMQGPVQRVVSAAALSTAYRFEVGQPVPGRESYVLERPLGEGGGSDVWLARHAKLGQQRVFKFAEDGARLAALKREYTLFRLLRHELGERHDLAHVVDAHLSSAPYFLECEYGGSSLLEWAEQDGRLAAMPQPERLALFLQMARAVAAAHSVGVLHKDIKPANVLVAGGPGAWQVRLTDFGSGRLLEPSRLEALRLTAMGATMAEDAPPGGGTPLYLAPELLKGQAPSMQSDVYALGVTLFQLLVGDLRQPLATGWQREVGDDLLCADIAAATEGRPEERLGSASELVGRIAGLAPRRQEQARTQQLAADAASMAMRLERARGRRPWLVASVSALVLGLATSLWLQSAATAAGDLARAEAARASAINDFLNQDVIMAADVTTMGSGRTMRAEDVLNVASSRAGERFKGQAQAEAAVRMSLGELYLRLGQVRQAESEFRQGLNLLEAEAPGPAVAAERLFARYALARALLGLSRAEDAKVLLAAADAELQRTPSLLNERIELAAARAKIVFHAYGMEFDQALGHAERGVALAGRLYPGNLSEQFLLRRALAEIQFRSGRYDALEANLSVTLSPPYTPEAVGEVTFARAQINLARLQAHRGLLPEAEKTLRTAQATLVQRLGADDATVGQVHEELAFVLQDQGKLQQARQAFGDAAGIQQHIVGADNPQTRMLQLLALIVDSYLGQPAQALAGMEQAHRWFAQNIEGGERSPQVQLIDFHRARLLLDLGRAAQAGAVLAGLEVAQLARIDPSPIWDARVQAQLARQRMALGERQEGLQRLAREVQRMRAAGASAWEVAQYESVARQQAASTAHNAAP